MASKGLFPKPTNVVPLFSPSASGFKKVDADTVDALEQLLRLAKAGEIDGLAFVFSRPGLKYMTDITGFFAKHPAFACGAISTLDDELAAHVHHRDPDGVR